MTTRGSTGNSSGDQLPIQPRPETTAHEISEIFERHFPGVLQAMGRIE